MSSLGYVRVCFLLGLIHFACTIPRAMKQRVSQEGLNKVIKDWIETDLPSFIQKYEEKNKTFEVKIMANSKVHISNLSDAHVDGLRGHVDILADNMVTVTLGFTRLSLNADITLITNSNSTYNPSAPTSLHLIDASLNLTLHLAPANETEGINIITCSAAIKEFDAGGEIAPQLKGLFFLAHAQLNKLVEEVCPFLEKETKEQLKSILIIKETIDFKNYEDEKIEVRFSSYTISTDGNYAETVAVLREDKPLDSDILVLFPPTSAIITQKELEIWVNSPLMAYLANMTIYQGMFENFKYTLTMGQTFYGVEAITESVDPEILVTEQGMSLLIRSSRHALSHTSHGAYQIADCIKVWVNLAAVIPFSITFNDVDVEISPDIDRLQLVYNVTGWNGSCPLPILKTDIDEMQRSIMKQYNAEFERTLKGKSMKIVLPYAKDAVVFKDTVVELVKDSLVVSADLEVGPVSTQKTERTTLQHTTYVNKYRHITYSTGTTDVYAPINGAGTRKLFYLGLILSVLITLC